MARKCFDKVKLRRSKSGMLFGVCKGIAEWRDLPIDLVRIAFVVLNIVGLLPLWIYLVLALVLPVEDEYEDPKRYRDEDIENLKSRMHKMENQAFDKEKERDWENRFYKT